MTSVEATSIDPNADLVRLYRSEIVRDWFAIPVGH
jgi:hypothetical protein